ncbi:MAG: SCP2 sterol-binding domain-containing protein [Deltaproteobacteria bacterium]|nr:SCP2 sterol-binding domain-containing protein [Deltaproteobacteria bacterium]
MADSCKQYFDEILPAKLSAHPELAEKVGAIYQFKITGEGGGDWTVDLVKNEVREGDDADAKCTVTVADADFLKVIDGSLNAQMAFMSGKLKIGGDLSLAMKLGEVLKA